MAHTEWLKRTAANLRALHEADLAAVTAAEQHLAECRDRLLQAFEAEWADRTAVLEWCAAGIERACTLPEEDGAQLAVYARAQWGDRGEPDRSR